MGKHGQNERPGAHRKDGWDDPRRDERETSHDDTRLTHEERYGVRSNIPFPDSNKK